MAPNKTLVLGDSMVRDISLLAADVECFPGRTSEEIVKDFWVQQMLKDGLYDTIITVFGHNDVLPFDTLGVYMNLPSAHPNQNWKHVFPLHMNQQAVDVMQETMQRASIEGYHCPLPKSAWAKDGHLTTTGQQQLQRFLSKL